jgi:hypothetical protein
MRFWFAACLTILSICAARAADFAPMPIAEMARRAQLIVRATVESKSVRKDDHGRIFTEVKLAVRDIWKGDLKTPTLTVVHGGGILGEEKTLALGQVDYQVGENLVGFYVWNQRGEAVTLGMSQGKLHLKDDDRAAAEIKARVLEATK